MSFSNERRTSLPTLQQCTTCCISHYVWQRACRPKIQKEHNSISKPFLATIQKPPTSDLPIVANMLPMLPNSNRKPNTFAPQSYHYLSTLSTPQHNTAPPSTTTAYGPDFDLAFGLGDYNRSFTSSPSPSLTYSGLSDHSPFEGSLSTFDQNPTSASPRTSHSLFDDAPLFANNDSMQDWYLPNNTHLTPRSVGRAHQRESSLSSLGSNGPASPHLSNTVNPFIAPTDSGVDGLHAMHNGDDFNNHFQLAKSYNPSGQHDMLFPLYTQPESVAMYPRSSAPPKRRMNHQQPFIGPGPVSGASSINSESPATPAEELDAARRSQKSEDSAPLEMLSSSPSLPILRDTVLPKLERTESDIMNAELCSPIFSITSSNTSQPQPSRNNPVFDRSLQHAYSNSHLSASGTASRAASPFQKSSPLAQMPAHNFSNYGSTQNTRPQQQMGNTISPKDAMLDYHNVGDGADFPLFPPTQQGFGMESMNKAMPQGMADSMGFNSFVPDLHITAPYNQFHGLPHSGVPSLSNSLAPTRLGSAETGMDLSPSSSPQRPARAGADGGTYSCTYHGCPRRFDSPQLLQKHKKEGHRGGGTRRAESVAPGLTSALVDSQTGPHRCERINPSTGNPCNRVFSRPYDLTRHESTVHDPNKQKVLCDLCVEEKSFSRGDALTRHYRVCHPEHEVPAKYRKRHDPHR